MEADQVAQSSSSENHEVRPDVIFAELRGVVRETRNKVIDMKEATVKMSGRLATTALEAVTFLDPEILQLLHEVECQGRQMDRLVAETQKMKKTLLTLAEDAHNSSPSLEYYQKELEGLGLLRPNRNQ